MANHMILLATMVLTSLGTTCFARNGFPVSGANGNTGGVASASYTPGESIFADTERKFSFKLFLELSKTNRNKNLAISPYGIFECFYFLHEFTKDQAKSEIADALGIPNGEDLDSAAKSLRHSLSVGSAEAGNRSEGGSAAAPLAAQNILLFDSQYSLTEKARTALAESFLMEGLPVDWSSSDSSNSATEKVNQIFSRATSDRLKDFGFKSESRPPGSVVLLNLCYFKDTWFKQFDKNLTPEKPFNCADGSKPLATYISDKGRSARWLEHAYFKLVEIPYKSASRPMNMILVLPEVGVQTDVVVQSLSELNCLSRTSERPQWKSSWKKVDLRVPKFKLKSNQVNIKEASQGIGVRSVFMPSAAAGIAGLFENDPPLFVESFEQDAFLQFDEEGTEAAALTKVEMGTYSLPPPQVPNKQFVADRPFMFFLVDNSGMVYFAGQVAKPEWKNEERTLVKGNQQLQHGQLPPPSVAIAQFVNEHRGRDGVSIDVSRLKKIDGAYKPTGPEQTYTIHQGTQSTIVRHDLQTNTFTVVVNGGFTVNTYRSH